MDKKKYILIFLEFLAVILFGYLWLWNPLEKKYVKGSGIITIIAVCGIFLNFVMNYMFMKDQSQKGFKKENEITLRIYQLILILSVIVYYLFISPVNAVILGISLFIIVLISGVCLFIYAKKRNNKNTALQ